MTSTAPRKQPLARNLDLSSSPSLLAALRAAHRQMEAAMRDLEAAMAEGAPDSIRFSAMRMRVGQAFLAKRQLIGRVSTHLISLVVADEGSKVRNLQSRDHHYSQLVSEIIRTWPPDAIQHDWSGYCAASSDLRAGILDLISAEKALLYPLLERQHSATHD